MLQIKTDLYRYVHYTSNVAVCNYQELIGCDVSFMVVLISERHGGLFGKKQRVISVYRIQGSDWKCQIPVVLENLTAIYRIRNFFMPLRIYI